MWTAHGAAEARRRRAEPSSPHREVGNRDTWRLAIPIEGRATNMGVVEIKAFVPAKDFELSKRFYADLGFTIAWSSDDLAYLHIDASSFLLQKFYVEQHAGNFMMHMLVDDVEAWWGLVQSQGIAARYGVRLLPPEDRPWGIRDFVLVDPTGVLWRIGQNIDRA
jgi:catechol 2,3-dioxygenase-like lactoylglutathione lyase family enzyme